MVEFFLFIYFPIRFPLLSFSFSCHFPFFVNCLSSNQMYTHHTSSLFTIHLILFLFFIFQTYFLGLNSISILYTIVCWCNISFIRGGTPRFRNRKKRISKLSVYICNVCKNCIKNLLWGFFPFHFYHVESRILRISIKRIINCHNIHTQNLCFFFLTMDYTSKIYIRFVEIYCCHGDRVVIIYYVFLRKTIPAFLFVTVITIQIVTDFLLKVPSQIFWRKTWICVARKIVQKNWKHLSG